MALKLLGGCCWLLATAAAEKSQENLHRPSQFASLATHPTPFNGFPMLGNTALPSPVSIFPSTVPILSNTVQIFPSKAPIFPNAMPLVPSFGGKHSVATTPLVLASPSAPAKDTSTNRHQLMRDDPLMLLEQNRPISLKEKSDDISKHAYLEEMLSHRGHNQVRHPKQENVSGLKQREQVEGIHEAVFSVRQRQVFYESTQGRRLQATGVANGDYQHANITEQEERIIHLERQQQEVLKAIAQQQMLYQQQTEQYLHEALQSVPQEPQHLPSAVHQQQEQPEFLETSRPQQEQPDLLEASRPQLEQTKHLEAPRPQQEQPELLEAPRPHQLHPNQLHPSDISPPPNHYIPMSLYQPQHQEQEHHRTSQSAQLQNQQPHIILPPVESYHQHLSDILSPAQQYTPISVYTTPSPHPQPALYQESMLGTKSTESVRPVSADPLPYTPSSVPPPAVPYASSYLEQPAVFNLHSNTPYLPQAPNASPPAIAYAPGPVDFRGGALASGIGSGVASGLSGALPGSLSAALPQMLPVALSSAMPLAATAMQSANVQNGGGGGYMPEYMQYEKSQESFQNEGALTSSVPTASRSAGGGLGGLGGLLSGGAPAALLGGIGGLGGGDLMGNMGTMMQAGEQLMNAGNKFMSILPMEEIMQASDQLQTINENSDLTRNEENQPAVRCASAGITCCIPEASVHGDWKRRPLLLNNARPDQKHCKANFIPMQNSLCATTTYKGDDTCGLTTSETREFVLYRHVLKVGGLNDMNAVCECRVLKDEEGTALNEHANKIEGFASWEVSKKKQKDVEKRKQSKAQLSQTLGATIKVAKLLNDKSPGSWKEMASFAAGNSGTMQGASAETFVDPMASYAWTQQQTQPLQLQSLGPTQEQQAFLASQNFQHQPQDPTQEQQAFLANQNLQNQQQLQSHQSTKQDPSMQSHLGTPNGLQSLPQAPGFPQPQGISQSLGFPQAQGIPQTQGFPHSESIPQSQGLQHLLQQQQRMQQQQGLQQELPQQTQNYSPLQESGTRNQSPQDFFKAAAAFANTALGASSKSGDSEAHVDWMDRVADKMMESGSGTPQGKVIKRALDDFIFASGPKK